MRVPTTKGVGVDETQASWYHGICMDIHMVGTILGSKCLSSLPYAELSFGIATHVIHSPSSGQASNDSEKSMRRISLQQLLGSRSAPVIVFNNLVFALCQSLFRGRL